MWVKGYQKYNGHLVLTKLTLLPPLLDPTSTIPPLASLSLYFSLASFRATPSLNHHCATQSLVLLTKLLVQLQQTQLKTIALGLHASLRQHLCSSARLGTAKTAFVELTLGLSKLKPFAFLLSNLAAPRASSTGWNLYNDCSLFKPCFSTRRLRELNRIDIWYLLQPITVHYARIVEALCGRPCDAHRIDDAAAPVDQWWITLGGNHTVLNEALQEIFSAPCSPDLHAHGVELPNTGAFITFICVPVGTFDPWRVFGLIAESLNKHIPSSRPKIHIFQWPIARSVWLSDQSSRDSLANRFRSKGFVHESAIILMTFDWGRDRGHSLEEYEKREVEVGRAFQGYPFLLERLESGSIEHCWELVQRVVGRLDRQLNGSNWADQDIIAQIKRDAKYWRVKWIQQDIDELYVELDKTPAGRLMRRRLKRASEDQSKYLKLVLALMDNEDLGEEERKRLEEKMEEEYALSRREFQRHFEIIREMEIPIGCYLREFYKLPPPIEPTPKKRFFFF
ncbi:hypothetical protein NP233_g11383 [Leucocoprinus birnbaumii]|uniref:Uncharacterized protein n=1 Tax=Leucocoprinus birnbaumii TaxID=56174 RepID=A0AAD5YR05_9AGAR|nr:hypothetical protein NP233_g11383 [Leucocoprinus birnbaumii]